MVFGYLDPRCKIEKDSEGPILDLLNNGCTEVVEEQCEIDDRHKLDTLIKSLAEGDMLMIRSLDEVAENFEEALRFIKLLMDKNIIFKIINMGTFDNTQNGQMLLSIFTLLVGFNEFKEKKVNKSNGKGNRNNGDKEKKVRYKKFTKNQIENALALLEINGGNCTYDEVAKETRISKSTLLREVNNRREKKNE